MSYSTEDTPGIKKFYTEKELQNEDDKGARGPKRPEAAPPANDNRTLYEKLQENKMKMDEDFADKVKYRPPKGLDQEDIDFFEERARKRLIREIENEEADQSELEKVFRSQRVVRADEAAAIPPPVVVVSAKAKQPANKMLQVKVVAKPKTASSTPPSTSSPSPSSSSATAPKRKLEEAEENTKAKKVQSNNPSSSSSKPASTNSSSSSSSSSASASSSKTSSSSLPPPELGPAPSANPNPLGGLLAYDDDDE